MMDNIAKIAALNREARRRGMSYGKLVASLSGEERQTILHRAERAKAARENRKRKKTAAP